ncbi:MAG: isoprenylcysteine carboxylmethyltransferase family protein [Anaerolineales bacterium]|nr:isoprenylcysteine carboxylmethyltransferase family protein [Anaerolineales bacterium]MCX7755671.1 isoprenylcysteine carboxylmethyltransferase family protein [Anaerolineales bacterium]MDW8279518.1 isoprenylcysteine carboxylmethyltransferase family protein [Anaerolineales bacterium]
MFRWLTFILLLFWLLVYWQGGLKLCADFRSALKSRVSRLDVFLLVFLAILGLGMTLTAAWTVFTWTKPAADSLLEGWGFILTLTGVIGTFFSRAVLGKFWAAQTATQSDHVVVVAGPYSVVRHPIYSFAILLYSGAGMVFPVWWNLLAAAGIVLGYALKAWEEERFLVRHLEGYAEYRRRVRWRLFPGLW